MGMCRVERHFASFLLDLLEFSMIHDDQQPCCTEGSTRVNEPLSPLPLQHPPPPLIRSSASTFFDRPWAARDPLDFAGRALPFYRRMLCLISLCLFVFPHSVCSWDLHPAVYFPSLTLLCNTPHQLYGLHSKPGIAKFTLCATYHRAIIVIKQDLAQPEPYRTCKSHGGNPPLATWDHGMVIRSSCITLIPSRHGSA